MRFFPERTKLSDIPSLTPPVTADEERWWAKERVKLYKRALLRFALPFFVAFTIGAIIVRPEELPWLLPRFVALACAMALFLGRTSEKGIRPLEIRWKRIRESLLADSVEEKP